MLEPLIRSPLLMGRKMRPELMPAAETHASMTDLLHAGIGNDTVTSIHVPDGTEASVYDAIDFTGRCETFSTDDNDLSDNLIGARRISSVRLGGGCGKTAPPQDDVVQLCGNTNYSACQTIDHDYDQLDNTTIYGDNAESVRPSREQCRRPCNSGQPHDLILGEPLSG